MAEYALESNTNSLAKIKTKGNCLLYVSHKNLFTCCTPAVLIGVVGGTKAGAYMYEVKLLEYCMGSALPGSVWVIIG